MASEAAIISTPLRLPDRAIKGFSPDAIGAQETRGENFNKYLKGLRGLGRKIIGRGKVDPEPEPIDMGWNTGAARAPGDRNEPSTPRNGGSPLPDLPPPSEPGGQSPDSDSAEVQRRQQARQSLDGILSTVYEGTHRWEGDELLRQDLPAGDSRLVAQADAYRKVVGLLGDADAQPFEVAQVSAFLSPDVRRSLYQDLYPGVPDEELALRILNSVPESGDVNRQAVKERISNVPHTERDALHVNQVSRALSEVIRENVKPPASGDNSGSRQGRESEEEKELVRRGARDMVDRLLRGEALPREFGGLTGEPLEEGDMHYIEQQASLKGLEYGLMMAGATDAEIQQIAESRFPNFSDIIRQDLARQDIPLPSTSGQAGESTELTDARRGILDLIDARINSENAGLTDARKGILALIDARINSETNAEYARKNWAMIARILGLDSASRETSVLREGSLQEVTATLNRNRNLKAWLKHDFESAEDCARYLEGAVFGRGEFGGDTIGELWLAVGPEVRNALLERADESRRNDVLGALDLQAEVITNNPDRYPGVDRDAFVANVGELRSRYLSPDTSKVEQGTVNQADSVQTPGVATTSVPREPSLGQDRSEQQSQPQEQRPNRLSAPQEIRLSEMDSEARVDLIVGLIRAKGGETVINIPDASADERFQFAGQFARALGEENVQYQYDKDKNIVTLTLRADPLLTEPVLRNREAFESWLEGAVRNISQTSPENPFVDREQRDRDLQQGLRSLDHMAGFGQSTPRMIASNILTLRYGPEKMREIVNRLRLTPEQFNEVRDVVNQLWASNLRKDVSSVPENWRNDSRFQDALLRSLEEPGGNLGVSEQNGEAFKEWVDQIKEERKSTAADRAWAEAMFSNRPQRPPRRFGGINVGGSSSLADNPRESTVIGDALLPSNAPDRQNEIKTRESKLGDQPFKSDLEAVAQLGREGIRVEDTGVDSAGLEGLTPQEEKFIQLVDGSMQAERPRPAEGRIIVRDELYSVLRDVVQNGEGFDEQKTQQVVDTLINDSRALVTVYGEQNKVNQEAVGVLAENAALRADVAVGIYMRVIEADNLDDIPGVDSLVKTAKYLGLARDPEFRPQLDNILRLYPEIDVKLDEGGN